MPLIAAAKYGSAASSCGSGEREAVSARAAGACGGAAGAHLRRLLLHDRVQLHVGRRRRRALCSGALARLALRLGGSLRRLALRLGGSLRRLALRLGGARLLRALEVLVLRGELALSALGAHGEVAPLLPDFA